MSSKKIILTYGTFDMFHIGHLNLLRVLSEMGSKLIVGVSTDHFNSIKGKDTLVPYEQRASIVAGIRYVDDVFEESTWDQKRDDIVRLGAHVFAIGDDWAGKFDDLSDLCEVAYVPRTEGISTTGIKQFSRAMIRGELENVLRGSERVSEIVGALLGKVV